MDSMKTNEVTPACYECNASDVFLMPHPVKGLIITDSDIPEVCEDCNDQLLDEQMVRHSFPDLGLGEWEGDY